jgi:hypothetical protein
MKESYGEGIANPTGPESCGVVDRKVAAEALTGVRTGRVWSREINALWREPWLLRGADAVEVSGRPHRTLRYRERRSDPARSETPSTYGSILHGNREVPRLSAEQGAADRIGKSKDVRR